MNTLEEFEAAPIGATATSPYRTVVKTGLSTAPWVSEVRYPGGHTAVERNTPEQLVRGRFILAPVPAVPQSAREALDLAWNLAHPVKEGQAIPEGSFYLAKATDGTIRPFQAIADLEFYSPTTFRTLDPLPEPEPDWLDAPAVLATCGCRGIELWERHNVKDGIWVSRDGENALWSTLRDVTPLYPKEDT